MNKNELQLKSFTSYCEQHPEERFWQALRNWAEVDFVLVGQRDPHFTIHGGIPWDVDTVRDTFYEDTTRAERIALEPEPNLPEPK